MFQKRNGLYMVQDGLGKIRRMVAHFLVDHRLSKDRPASAPQEPEKTVSRDTSLSSASQEDVSCSTVSTVPTPIQEKIRVSSRLLQENHYIYPRQCRVPACRQHVYREHLCISHHEEWWRKKRTQY